MKLKNLLFSNDIPTGLRILAFIGFAWLPLVVLTLFEGTFISAEIAMPFVKDVVPYVRGLVVIPLLVMADNVIEPMMLRTMRYLRVSGLVPEAEQAHLGTVSERIVYWINSK